MCLKKIFSSNFEPKKAYQLAVAAGVLQSLYVFKVVLLMNWLSSTLKSQPDNSIWMPFAFLLFFVFDATVSGLIVLGYPLYLVINKQISLAVKTVLVTLLTMLIIGVLAVAVILFLA